MMTNTTDSKRLRFDALTHTYSINDIVIPSVTQILKATGCVDDRWYTEEGRQRGEIVDKLTSAHDDGRLDYKELAKRYPEYMGYLEAWIQFRRAIVTDVIAIQEWVLHLEDGYAGTLDRRVRVLGGQLFLIDTKLGAKCSWHPLQTIAYARCLDEPHARACVYLRSDGTYRFVEHASPADEPAWQSVLTIYRYLHGA
ncbi:MAG: hypothetical protein AMJ84_13345 [Acidithiobacillales bacterium SM23_46]|nr:MAG: hypothetical protein AMJ84_13345 [Acidithiobacillales bacterium SM23_46]